MHAFGSIVKFLFIDNHLFIAVQALGGRGNCLYFAKLQMDYFNNNNKRFIDFRVDNAQLVLRVGSSVRPVFVSSCFSLVSGEDYTIGNSGKFEMAWQNNLLHLCWRKTNEGRVEQDHSCTASNSTRLRGLSVDTVMNAERSTAGISTRVKAKALIEKQLILSPLSSI